MKDRKIYLKILPENKRMLSDYCRQIGMTMADFCRLVTFAMHDRLYYSIAADIRLKYPTSHEWISLNRYVGVSIRRTERTSIRLSYDDYLILIARWDKPASEIICHAIEAYFNPGVFHKIASLISANSVFNSQLGKYHYKK